MSLARTIARNSLWSGVGMVVDLLLSPLASIIVARALGPAKLGVFSFVQWVSVVAVALGAGGISAAMRKYLADYAGQRRPEVFRGLIRLGVFYQTLLLSLLTLLGLAWSNIALPSDERLFASLTMLCILPAGHVSLSTVINAACQDVRPNSVASIFAAMVHTAGMILTVVMGWGLVGLAAANLAARICDGVLRWKLTMARMPGYLSDMGTNPSTACARPALPPGLGHQIASFFGESTLLTVLTLVVWNRSEMIFLRWYSPIEQVAFFSVAFGLSQIPRQILGPFMGAAGLSVYAERGRDQEAGLRVAKLYWRYLVLLVMPTCLGMAAMSGPLLRVLYGERYFDAVPALIVAGALSMFSPLVQPASDLITASGGQRALVWSRIFAAVVTLVLDYVLVRAWDATGGAFANGLGQAFAAVLTLMVAKRYSYTIAARFLLRVTGAACAMVAVVASTNHFLPDLASIVVGPLLGVLTYGAALRFGGLVESADIERLLKAEALLPGSLKALLHKLLYMLARSRPGSRPQDAAL